MPQRAGEERWRWLYGQLRAAILDHRLPPGARVPSSRNLAKQHGVSRGTVVAAVDHLFPSELWSRIAGRVLRRAPPTYSAISLTV
jgi:DNA-binding transcriptional MocR family regulator